MALLKGLTKNLLILNTSVTLDTTRSSTDIQKQCNVLGQRCKCAPLDSIAKAFCTEEVTTALLC